MPSLHHPAPLSDPFFHLEHNNTQHKRSVCCVLYAVCLCCWCGVVWCGVVWCGVVWRCVGAAEVSSGVSNASGRQGVWQCVHHLRPLHVCRVSCPVAALCVCVCVCVCVSLHILFVPQFSDLIFSSLVILILSMTRHYTSNI